MYKCSTLVSCREQARESRSDMYARQKNIKRLLISTVDHRKTIEHIVSYLN